MQKRVLITLVLIVIALNPQIFGEIGQGYSPIKPLSTIANISLLKPNGGEMFYVGATDTIKWSSTNIANVKIEYTTNNGTNWTTIIESTSAIAGGYAWTIPDILSANCKVRISNASDSSIADTSEAVFTIVELQIPSQIFPTNNSKGIVQPVLTNWTQSLGAQKYILQVSTSSNFASYAFVDSNLTDTTKLLPTLSNYIQYYWRVKAYNLGGASDWSEVWNFKMLGNPYASNLITPVNNTVNQPLNGLVFKWTKPQERIEAIQKYQYQLSTDSLFGSFVINDSTLTDTTKSLTGLTYLSKYYWRVRAQNQTGWGDWSEVWNTTTIIEKPTVPVLALPINDSKGLLNPITSKWKSSIRVEKYILQLSTDATFTNLIVNDSLLTDTTRLYPIASNYTQYYWRVKAYNAGGESDWSEVWNFKTLGSPYASNLVTPLNNSANQPVNDLVFKWTKAEERIETIQKYQFQLATDGGFTSIVTNDSTLTDTIKTVNSLSYLTKYYWRVRAKNQTGWGDWSAVWNTTTIIEKPANFTLLSPANNSMGQLNPVTVSWNTSARADKFILQLSTSSTFTSFVVDDSTQTDLTEVLPTLNNYTQYYWRVKSVNVGGESDWSLVWNFKTLGNPYVSNLVTPLNNSANQHINNLVFRWTKPEERIETILKYQYQLSTDSLFGSFVVNDSTMTDTITTIHNLNYSTKYFWRVRAGNETGWGDWAEVSRFTTIIEQPTIPLLALPLNNSRGLVQPVITKWNKSLRVEKYIIEVSTSSGFATIVYADSNLTDTIIQLPSLSNYTKYYWRVKSVNIGGESDWSEVWNFKTLGNPYASNLVTPLNNSVNQPIHNLVFKWTKPLERIEQIQKYQYQLSTDSLFGDLIINDSTLTDTTKTVSNISYLTKYFWRVRAGNQAGWGEWSEIYSFNTEGSFSNILTFELIDANQGSIKWGDYNNDGFLDILLSGNTSTTSVTAVTRVYKNNGDGTFQAITGGHPLMGVANGAAEWIDVNNDNFLDIIIFGIDRDQFNVQRYLTKLYINSNGVFYESNNYWGIGLNSADISVTDINGDGYQDFLVSGFNNGGERTDIYINNKNSNFSRFDNVIDYKVRDGSSDWGDYDSDGYKDLILCGNTGSGLISKVFKNVDGNLQQHMDWFTGVEKGSVRWGDYDNDGDLDILIAGWTGENPACKVYKNTNGGFSEVSSISIAGIAAGEAKFIDFDNDGLIDIIVSGSNITQLYKNMGDDIFTFVEVPSFSGRIYSSIASGDYDNDNDLDLLIIGSEASNAKTQLFRNNSAIPNTVPSPPANLSVNIQGTAVKLTWDKSTDGQSPQNSLTYNIAIGRSINSTEIISPLADLNTGFRRVVNFGNTGHLNSYQLKDLPGGYYYWRIQAIDGNYAGSQFSQVDSFFILEKPAAPVLISPLDNAYGIHGPIVFNWHKSAWAETFSIEVAQDIAFTQIITADSLLSDTAWILNNYSIYTQYFWRVKAHNNTGSSNWSEIRRFKTLGNPFSTVLVSPTNNTYNQSVHSISFYWLKPEERIETISAYHFQLAKDSAFANLVLNDTTLTDTTFVVSNLEYFTNYFWRVRSTNEVTWGDWSAIWKFTTIIEKPKVPLLSL
ncbi:MAG: VCBS repeat-containing protein, partial [Ignavibacteriaceae bacterium]|nr:VCBS repeat-containing protein [Ignavibacteriaceae bacterium]